MPEKATGAGKVLARMSLPMASGQQSLPHCLTTGFFLLPSIQDLGLLTPGRSVPTSNPAGVAQVPCPCCCPQGQQLSILKCQACARSCSFFSKTIRRRYCYSPIQQTKKPRFGEAVIGRSALAGKRESGCPCFGPLPHVPWARGVVQQEQSSDGLGSRALRSTPLGTGTIPKPTGLG